MEPIGTLITSVPQWYGILENLNDKIRSRQIELAEMGDHQPSQPSLKNKGSTESLRPRDKVRSAAQAHEARTLQSNHEILPNFVQSTDPAMAPILADCGSTPPLSSSHSSPGPSAALQKRISDRPGHTSLTKPSMSPVVRKRKTPSMMSTESQLPKYRTRSMIVVYYDSEVQHVFEELVRNISLCRNAMRKGKMAARMADMRRMADMEAESSDEETQLNGTPILDKQVTCVPSEAPQSVTGEKEVIKVDDRNALDMPKMQYIRTRRLAPPVNTTPEIANDQSTRTRIPLNSIPGALTPRMWRSSGLGPKTASSSISIFDELDGGLEWCQSMCEHAAHQFLRDGDCNTEITGLKRRLNEVREAAEKHQAQLPEADAAAAESISINNKTMQRQPELPFSLKFKEVSLPSDRGRSLKPIQMRRTPILPINQIETSCAMEVDEGFGDFDGDEEGDVPKLVWRSTRKI